MDIPMSEDINAHQYSTIDEKYASDINKIRERGNKHYKNIAFQMYKLNMLSKRILEWHLCCKNPLKTETLSTENDEKQTIKTTKQLLIENYKLEIKKQLFKNQLLRDSIMITKQKDFLNRTLKQNDDIYKKERIQNDLKFKIVAQSLKYKIDKINKYHKQFNHKIPKNNILHTLHKEINNIYNQIDFYHRSDQKMDKLSLDNSNDMQQDFDYIYKDLLDSAYNNTSNIAKLWKQYLMIYLYYGKQKGILSKEWESKLNILTQKDKKKVEYKDVKNILLNPKNYNKHEKTFLDNREIFRQLAKSKTTNEILNGNKNEKLYYNCDNEYTNESENECCVVNSDDLSVYSYEYNNNLSDISNDTSDNGMYNIDPIYRNIEMKYDELMDVNTNVPNLKNVKEKHKHYKHRKIHKKRREINDRNILNVNNNNNNIIQRENINYNQPMVDPILEESIPPLVEEKQEELPKVEISKTVPPIKNEPVIESDINNERFIPYLGHLPKQNEIINDIKPQTVIKPQPMDDNNNIISDKKMQFLQSFAKLHEGNKQHLEHEQKMNNSFQNLPQFPINNNINTNINNNKCETCHLTQIDFNNISEFMSHMKICNKINRKQSTIGDIPAFDENTNKITFEGMTKNLLWKTQKLYWNKDENLTLQSSKNLNELLNKNIINYSIYENKQLLSLHEQNNNNNISMDRLYNILDTTIQPNPSLIHPLKTTFEKYKQNSIQTMLDLKVSPNEFSIGYSKPQMLEYSKRKRCIIYKHVINNTDSLKQIKKPSDIIQNEIDIAPKFTEKQNLTCNNWIYYYNNNIKSKQLQQQSKQKVQTQSKPKPKPMPFVRPKIPKFKPKLSGATPK